MLSETSISPNINTSVVGLCEPCKEQIKKVAEAIEQGINLMENVYVKVFVDIGWIPNLYFGLRTTDKVMKYHQLGDKEKAEKLMRRYCMYVYNHELISATLRNWEKNHLLKKRIRILQEAVTAHKNNMYHSSVLIFLSQIEGFLFEATKTTGWAKQDKIKTILGDKDRFHMFAKALQEFAKTFLYENFTLGEEYSSTVSRNAIMHGYDTCFGTRANSLKLLILFDVIQSAFVSDQKIERDDLIKEKIQQSKERQAEFMERFQARLEHSKAVSETISNKLNSKLKAKE